MSLKSSITRRRFLKGAGAAVAANYSQGLVPGGMKFPKSKKDNPIVKENSKEGTVEWQLQFTSFDAPLKIMSSELIRFLRSSVIEGYASKTSVYPGESIDFFVSTDKEINFVVDIYRLGYYGGKGARHITKLGPFPGKPQKVPMMTIERLRECDWEKCTTFHIPSDWVSGVYLAKLTREEDFGIQSYIIFVVKERRKTDILFQVSDLTWQSYNKWPFSDSLYDDGSANLWFVGENVRVSFDRPYARCCQVSDSALSAGSGEFLMWEFPFAFWLEAGGYDVTYCSNIDIELEPEILKNCKAFLSVGHDEYWSRKMFNEVTMARDAGMSIGFFSGNAVGGEIIFYNSSVTGAPSRAFARKPVFEDEDMLMGVKSYGPGYGDWVVTKEDHWIYEGTNMKNGDYIPGLIGWEFHGTPRKIIKGLEVVASSEILRANWTTRIVPDVEGKNKHSAVVYPCPKGNWVFNAGTIWWAEGLSSPPGHIPARFIPVSGTFGIDPRVQQITRNILNRFIADSPFKW